MPLIESEIRKISRRKEWNSGKRGPKTPQEMFESQSTEHPSFHVVPSGKVQNFNALLKQDLTTHVGDLNIREVTRIIPLIDGFPRVSSVKSPEQSK